MDKLYIFQAKYQLGNNVIGHLLFPFYLANMMGSDEPLSLSEITVSSKELPSKLPHSTPAADSVDDDIEQWRNLDVSKSVTLPTTAISLSNSRSIEWLAVSTR
jgi:hypothetical protein